MWAFLQSVLIFILMSAIALFAWWGVGAWPRLAAPRFIVLNLAWKVCAAIGAVMMAMFAASLAASGNASFEGRASFIELCGFLLFVLCFPFFFAVAAFFSATWRKNEWPYGATMESGRRNLDPGIEQAHKSWMLWTDNEVPRAANALLFAAGSAFAITILFGLALFGQFAPSAFEVTERKPPQQPTIAGAVSNQTRELNVSVNVGQSPPEAPRSCQPSSCPCCEAPLQPYPPEPGPEK